MVCLVCMCVCVGVGVFVCLCVCKERKENMRRYCSLQSSRVNNLFFLSSVESITPNLSTDRWKQTIKTVKTYLFDYVCLYSTTNKVVPSFRPLTEKDESLKEKFHFVILSHYRRPSFSYESDIFEKCCFIWKIINPWMQTVFLGKSNWPNEW